LEKVKQWYNIVNMPKEKNGKQSEQTCVLIAHPHSLVSEGVHRIISDSGLLVIGQVHNLDDLYKVAAERNPDLVVVDFRLLNQDTDLVDNLKGRTTGQVVILAIPEEIEEAPEALKAGAKGYLSYSQTSDEFIKSLSLLGKGSVVVSNVAGEQVQSSISKGVEDSIDISEREKEVAKLVAQGATNRQIADKLMVSQHTVKIHLHNILNKLDLKNRQQLAAYAIKEGLVEDIKTEDFS
jgi:DNA-binding NarL/FixJ family response regulator